MGKVIAVASGKGGTGKTTTVAAIASCLAALGHKTLCIDFDAGLNNLDLSLCMTEYTVADYMDVVLGRLGIMEASHEHPLMQNLYFLSAPPVHIPHSADDEAIRSLFAVVKNEFEYCITASPSGIGEGFRLAHIAADMSIIVTQGELPAIRDAERAVEVSRLMGVREQRLLVNRVEPGTLGRMRTTIDDVIDSVGAQLIGVIREDKYIPLSLNENIPLVLYRKRRSAYDFLDVARRIAGEVVPIRRLR